ncbi:MATE family efflux transporter [Photobacterium phosphoreum]|jgi:putative MATE family efflux protein|uniref:Multidrug resistance protein NorM n=1 Tax=Photobacterium phosphoreum TaxID=659 RepID=A0AAW5A1K3_PHOPO|nr:MATE family efflux transporter [Photobacterium phosphoreum]MCD9476772.1 MATE family efflux transporter [Photobacterium phosphoreum]MCD9480946.1 MATE family efflux transporter [Photobacterium phosphoreum]MCD9485032.1 MATE family efflux transporter [Photobacterium phosphoreum]MCD9492552.1 MATE family efflux transporter [Photobacterium phosphoreum]MCD9504087.1 MATE family efflux transporter [Photobacterium phosphoreum]
MATLLKPDKHGLLSAPIPDALRRLAVPMVFGMIAILMFNLVDTFFISRLGTNALAAVSFTFPVTFGLNCITMGMNVGISTSIGRMLGQGDSHSAARITTHGLLLSLLLMIIGSSIGLLTIKPLFTLMGASAELLPIIEQYMTVWYIAIPLLVIPMAGNSAIRATGDAKSPAKIMVIAGIINGLLDPLLIFGYGSFPALGVKGAAIASGISWVFALIASLYLLYQREKLLILPQWRLLKNDWQQILHIGVPAGLSTALNPLSGALLMALLASQSTASVAAYGAAMRVESLLVIVMMALGSALMPFMAQNLGAQKPQRAFSALFTAMHFALGFQLLVFIAMVPLSMPLAALFSKDGVVQNQLWHYLLVVPASYGLQAICMLLISALNALHKTIYALCWNLLRLFVLLLPAAWIGSYLYGTEGLFIGIAAANVVSGIGAYYYARKLRNSMLSPQ